jgi:hypothetical protein
MLARPLARHRPIALFAVATRRVRLKRARRRMGPILP